MEKILFVPVSIGTGWLAGTIGKKLFGLVWGKFDDQEPPQAEHRDVSLPKLGLALVLEGALSSLIRGLIDHGSRHAFARVNGTWPGDEGPERA